MLNIFARASVSRALAPVGARLARAGVTPDQVTLVGTLGAVAGALIFFTRGHFFVGTMVIWFFVMWDLLDGAVARARGGSSRFGAWLDSTCDRVADAAVFGSLLWWFAGPGDSRPLVLATLLCLVLGMLTSYVKARAEGLGLTCDVGVAERGDRLTIALVGTGLDGLGVPYVQAGALWLLVGLSTITVGQRLVEVRRQAAEPSAMPGAEPGAMPDAEAGAIPGAEAGAEPAVEPGAGQRNEPVQP
jgi:CDP-diacylglycerol---glycerol-3-phosphate 3-phosphatidyltransferase